MATLEHWIRHYDRLFKGQANDPDLYLLELTPLQMAVFRWLSDAQPLRDHLVLGEYTNNAFWLTLPDNTDHWRYTLIDPLRPGRFFTRYHQHMAKRMQYTGQHHVLNRECLPEDMKRPADCVWMPGDTRIITETMWQHLDPSLWQRIILAQGGVPYRSGIQHITKLNRVRPLRMQVDRMWIFDRSPLPDVITDGSTNYLVEKHHDEEWNYQWVHRNQLDTRPMFDHQQSFIQRHSNKK